MTSTQPTRILILSDIVQLRTDRAVSIRREHFEPGQSRSWVTM